MLSIDSYIKSQYKFLNNEIQKLDTKISSLPDGKLFARANGDYYKYYSKTGTETTYITKDNMQLAKDLALKQQLILEREILYVKRHSLEIINDITKDSEANYLAFITNPKFKNLLLSNHSNSKLAWQNAPYVSNPNYPEQLTFKCPSGQMVRSKSEVFIDMVLNKYAIPYRYECELLINNQSIFPDFTLLNPKTNSVLYWEHFGLMDNNNYASNAFSKLRHYYENGIIPGKNLITTFETKSHPFSSRDAEAAISFLMT